MTVINSLRDYKIHLSIVSRVLGDRIEYGIVRVVAQLYNFTGFLLS